MTKSELIRQVLEEMDRVWGKEGLHGEPKEYDWLLTNFGIGEEEDVQWQLILQHHMGDLLTEDQEDDEVMLFLEDKQAVIQFLEAHLSKYQSSSATYAQQA